MKWLKKFWQWIVAGAVGLGLLVFALVKYILDQKDVKSKDNVTTVTTNRNVNAHEDAGTGATAIVHAEGVEDATNQATHNVIVTTEPATPERLDGLTANLNTMRRKHDAERKSNS